MDFGTVCRPKGHEFVYAIHGCLENIGTYLIRAFNEDVPYDSIRKGISLGDLILKLLAENKGIPVFSGI